MTTDLQGQAEKAKGATPRRSRKRLVLAVFALALLGGGGGYGRYWWETGRFL